MTMRSNGFWKGCSRTRFSGCATKAAPTIFRILKRSADPAYSSSGCQEDYLVGRVGRVGRLADILIPFLVTRQIICGASAVVPTPGGTMYGSSLLARRTASAPPQPSLTYRCP
jgi:hypothetical protein